MKVFNRCRQEKQKKIGMFLFDEGEKLELLAKIFTLVKKNHLCLILNITTLLIILSEIWNLTIIIVFSCIDNCHKSERHKSDLICDQDKLHLSDELS